MLSHDGPGSTGESDSKFGMSGKSDGISSKSDGKSISISGRSLMVNQQVWKVSSGKSKVVQVSLKAKSGISGKSESAYQTVIQEIQEVLLLAIQEQ